MKVLLLNERQIANLIHDYIATNAKSICLDNSIKTTSSFVTFDKDSVAVVACFCRRYRIDVDLCNLGNLLPNTGNKNIILPCSAVKKALKDGKMDCARLIYGSETKYAKMPLNSVRLIKFNKDDILSMLRKQMFEIVCSNFLGVEFKSSV